MFQTDYWDLRQVERLRGFKSCMASNDLIILIDQNRHNEAKAFDAPDERSNLSGLMSVGIPRIRMQRGQCLIDHDQRGKTLDRDRCGCIHVQLLSKMGRTDFLGLYVNSKSKFPSKKMKSTETLPTRSHYVFLLSSTDADKSPAPGSTNHTPAGLAHQYTAEPRARNQSSYRGRRQECGRPRRR